MPDRCPWLPERINTGPWLVDYSFEALARRIDQSDMVLPICSVGTPLADLERLAPLVLPPLYHEALDPTLKTALLSRIDECFPYLKTSRKRRAFTGSLEVIEIPPATGDLPRRPSVLAFSVDTAVEEHGPHLPLSTDRIQSYAILGKLVDEFEAFAIAPPVDYGHLTWGLPLGLSIDITPPLLERYVTGYVNALQAACAPNAFYVVDVHGSPDHRQAICDGLAASCAERWAFRWLHEPLTEFAGDRGDQHAGGVETAMLMKINPALVDTDWWPDRIDELAATQMPLATAVDLSNDLSRFLAHAESHAWNGIVGDIRNFFTLDKNELFDRALDQARDDVRTLMATD